jgi:hypothetical protein
MNEVSYRGESPTPDGERRTLPPAEHTMATGSSQELAQKILMGMQHDIEAQIDWRLQQRQGKSRSVDQNEIGVILGSVGIGVPLTAIAGAAAGLPAIIVIWVSLVLINLAWARRR